MTLRSIAFGFALCPALAFGADTCPVTKAPEPRFVPPSEYPEAPGNSFYLGTPKLWVVIYPGPWRGLPHGDAGYAQKIAWFREGYNAKDDPKPAIAISGRRLDGNAPPLVVDGANGSWTTVDFIMSGVNFPTTGCWEITGKFKGEELRFVALIE